VNEFAPFAFLREQFGSVPSVFLAQTLRPDVLEAEASAIRALLFADDALSRVQKERLLFAGKSSEAGADGVLLNFARKLSADSREFSANDIQVLRDQGFTEEQILEAVVTTSLACFFNMLQVGLGSTPDFAAKWTSRPADLKIAKKAHLSASDPRHINVIVPLDDPDGECVTRVQAGDLDAFEELMNRHSQRVYRTLVGILGNPDDARDAMQDTFLKAFQHLARFEGRAKFSTWLVSIATNTGIQRLRERRPMESLGETSGDEEGFRPRQVQAWTDDPEQLYSQAELRSILERGVMKLPAKYRVVLMLRDIEQLSVEETAAALGLGIPAFKARLLRGRLMLREALAPQFIGTGPKGSMRGATL
jgi:RNA polymerase sigma-70 factor (ECF subfamily)